jgi:hypothetical protein
MNIELIKAAMARADGQWSEGIGGSITSYTMDKCRQISDCGKYSRSIPSYTISDNDCDRMIREFDWDVRFRISVELSKIICGDTISDGPHDLFACLLRATALQKCEAILRALNLWTKEMEWN